MTLQILFWFLMIIWLLFGFWERYTPTPPPLSRWGGMLLIFILLGILGWQVFGAPIHH